MARAALTRDEIDAFRQEAARVAIGLFAERGYRGVSMRAVASTMGVSAMTPYRYFENKDELFNLIRTEGFRRFADRQAAAWDHSSPSTRLLSLKQAYVQFALDEPETYQVMFELRDAPEQDTPALDAEQKRAYSFLLAGVQEAIDAGRLDGDPDTVAHLLWAQVHGMVSLHLAGTLIMGRNLEQLCELPIHTQRSRS